MIKNFTQTSDEPYNRHRYKIVFSEGKEIILDDYEHVQAIWFQTASSFLSHVEVLDEVKPPVKGFKNGKE
jgi:hypothetical protein